MSFNPDATCGRCLTPITEDWACSFTIKPLVEDKEHEPLYNGWLLCEGCARIVTKAARTGLPVAR